MGTLGALMDGFATACTMANLGWCVLGVTLGTAIGTVASPSRIPRPRIFDLTVM